MIDTKKCFLHFYKRHNYLCKIFTSIHIVRMSWLYMKFLVVVRGSRDNEFTLEAKNIHEASSIVKRLSINHRGYSIKPALNWDGVRAPARLSSFSHVDTWYYSKTSTGNSTFSPTACAHPVGYSQCPCSRDPPIPNSSGERSRRAGMA